MPPVAGGVADEISATGLADMVWGREGVGRGKHRDAARGGSPVQRPNTRDSGRGSRTAYAALATAMKIHSQ